MAALSSRGNATQECIRRHSPVLILQQFQRSKDCMALRCAQLPGEPVWPKRTLAAALGGGSNSGGVSLGRRSSLSETLLAIEQWASLSLALLASLLAGTSSLYAAEPSIAAVRDFRGLTLRLVPHTSITTTSADFEIRASIRNVAVEQRRVDGLPEKVHNYRIVAFDREGRPVLPASDMWTIVEEGNPLQYDSAYSFCGAVLDPAESVFDRLNMSQWIKPTSPGTYDLIAFSRLRYWGEGMLISDLARFTVVDTNAVAGERVAADTGAGLIFGLAFKGMAISVEPVPVVCRGSDLPRLRVVVTNSSSEQFLLSRVQPLAHTYKVVVFDEVGLPLACRTSIRSEEEKGDPTLRDRTYPVETEQVAANSCVLDELNLNDWAQITCPGLYKVLVLRRTRRWDDGFLISNLGRFRVLETDAVSSPTNCSAARTN